MKKVLIGYCAVADIIVRESVTSSSPAVGASEGEIGIAAIIEKPTGDIITVTNPDEAFSKLGGYMKESTLMYGLDIIFGKLGNVPVHISPVTHRTDTADPDTEVGDYATAIVGDGDSVDIFTVTANFMGTKGNEFAVRISDVNPTAKTYSVEILKNESLQGTKLKDVKNTTFLKRVANAELSFIMLVGDDETLPEEGVHKLQGGVDAHTGVNAADFDRAINALKTKNLDFIIVDSTLTANIVTALSVGDQLKAMAYVSTEADATDEEALQLRALLNSKYGRLLHPHQYVSDPLGSLNEPNRKIPITYDAVANQVLAYKQVGRRQVSAGLEYGSLSGLGLVSEPNPVLLDGSGVNYAIVDTVTGGTYIWDATTLSNDPDWTDLNRVQLLSYIRKSIVPSLRPDLFKASDPDVWSKTRTRAVSFMEGVYKRGDLYGNSATEAFFVQCDENNNPREEQIAKRMHIKVGYKDKMMIKNIVLDIEVS